MEVKSFPRGISGQFSFLSIKLNTEANLRVCLFVGDLTITKKANNKVVIISVMREATPPRFPIIKFHINHYVQLPRHHIDMILGLMNLTNN